MPTQTREMVQVLHVRYAGRSFDLPLAGLQVSADSSDREVKQQLAAYLEVAASDLDSYVVDRHQNGNLTVRPEAVFG